MLDQKTQERSPDVRANQTNRWLVVLTVVLVLAVVGIGAWALSERNRAEDLSADLATAESQLDEVEAQLTEAEGTVAELEATPTDVVVIGGGPLTARQREMVDLVNGPWNDAWVAADGEAIAAFFTPDGVMYDFEGGEVLTVADGTIASFGSRWPGLHVMEGMLVHGHRVVTVVELSGEQVGAIMDFTETGELLIESTAMYNTILGPNR